jgi:spastic paraplegia protein 7
MLGGRVAEQIVFNQVSTGAQDDLKRATKLAYAQIKQFGMSKTIGLISFPADQQNPQNDDFGVKPYSKRLQRMMDEVIIYQNIYNRENFVLILGSSTTSCQCL